MSTNPYAAPRAQVADDTVIPLGNFVAAGRSVPMGNGWSWIADAWSLFRQRAGLLIGMFVVSALIMVALVFIPFIGPIAQSLLWPVFIAGFVITFGKIERGEPVEFAELFAGFRQGLGTLIATGVIGMLVSAVIVFIAIAVLGTAFFSTASAEVTAAQLMSLALVSLVILALLVPLIMALWFAPALVVFHDMGAWEAMKASFRGGMKNMLPFLLYGIVLTIASVLASIPALLGWLVLGPVIAASIYTSYRDIYFSEA
jgi:hypothetical protein